MPPIQILPAPNPGPIIGRKDLLARIHADLRSGKPVALVHGIGGIGKTTAAAAYAHHPEYSLDYEAVCWLEITSNIPNAFVACRPLQEFLGVEEKVSAILSTPQPETGLSMEQRAFMEVLDGLRHNGKRLLLLIDNANEEEDIRKSLSYLLQTSQLRLLVTSRANCDDFNPIPVEALPPDEAAVLFRQHYGDERLPGEPERQEVYDMLGSFDFHTLLVEMLGKIGKTVGYTLPELLKNVRELTLQDENWQIAVGTGQSGRTHRMSKETLKGYISHLFREIKDLQEEDTGLLRRLAVLPNRAYNTEELGRLLALDEVGCKALRKQLAALDTRGIPLQDAHERGLWRMHPLFREMCLDQLGPFTGENLSPLVDVIGKMVVVTDETLNYQVPFDNRYFADELLLHSAEGDKWKAYLQNQLGLCYIALGQYTRARDLLEKALRSFEQNFGEEHPSTVTISSNLGDVLRNLGDYEGAKTLLEKALRSDEKNFGEEHPKTAIRYSILALVLQSLGDYDGAKMLLEKALRSDEKNFGEEHPKTAIRYSNLALVLRDLKDYEGAKTLLEKALRSDEKNFGEEHPTTAVRYSNLAVVLQDLGEYEGAKTLLEKALRSDEKNFGEEHPTTALHYSNLATVHQDLGDYQGAKTMLEKALRSDEKNFGEHPSTAIRLNNLAFVLEDLNQKEEAIEKWIACYKMREKVLPEGHPAIQRVFDTLRERGIDPTKL